MRLRRRYEKRPRKNRIKRIKGEEKAEDLIFKLRYEPCEEYKGRIDFLFSAPIKPYVKPPYSPNEKFTLFEITSFKGKNSHLKNLAERTKEAQQIIRAKVGKVLFIYDRSVTPEFINTASKFSTYVWDIFQLQFYSRMIKTLEDFKGFTMENLTTHTVGIFLSPKILCSSQSLTYTVQIFFDNMVEMLRFKEGSRCLEMIKKIIKNKYKKVNDEIAKIYNLHPPINVRPITFVCPFQASPHLSKWLSNKATKLSDQSINLCDITVIDNLLIEP
jgi:hypothetical protein